MRDLARYFTGEAASSRSDEAVRVLRISHKAALCRVLYLCVIPSEAEGPRIFFSALA